MRYLHTMVRVQNLEESLNFYCTKLGLIECNRLENEDGRFTLVYLAAPNDAQQARESHAPLLELTYNWDKESYAGGRNFGHLAFEVDNIYTTCPAIDAARCGDQPPTARWMDGFCTLPRFYFYRTAPKRPGTALARAVDEYAE